ncbi:MAG: hypothetical protein ABIQ56_06275 [Chitinophagaceae bacterium]
MGLDKETVCNPKQYQLQILIYDHFYDERLASYFIFAVCLSVKAGSMGTSVYFISGQTSSNQHLVEKFMLAFKAHKA